MYHLGVFWKSANRLCSNHCIRKACTHNLFRKYDVSKKLTIAEYQFVSDLAVGVRKSNRASLARAITLIESNHKRKKMMGQALLQMVLSQLDGKTSKSFRLGLSGPPGAGKSTFIETFGTYLTEVHNMNVAVLAVDPSSARTGGSLLGDKTRMTNLSRNPRAYIRPSPAQGTLGGVTRNTTEAMLLCESAGYDIIIVETVGVGQSEVAVANMTDQFVLLIPPASGDELQGIKRGIVELVDLVVVNKADGDLAPSARRIQAEYTSALKFIPRKYDFWRPRVRRVSSVTGQGISELWDVMQLYRASMDESGQLASNRMNQRVVWMWNHIENDILEHFRSNENIANAIPTLTDLVRTGKMSSGLAADMLLDQLFKNKKSA